MNDKVNHPSHYQRKDRKECIVEMEELCGDDCVAIFCYLNAYKYLYRAGEKNNESYLDDLNKAKWYIHYASCKVLMSDECHDKLSKLIKNIKEHYPEVYEE